MRIGISRSMDSFGRRHWHGVTGGIMAAAVVLALTLASPASAANGATATAAPIGAGGSYLVTVSNTGSEPITQFIFVPGEEPPATNVVPSPACQAGPTPVPGSINCNVTLAPGASTQMCYTGHAPAEAFPGASMLVSFSAGSSFIPVSTAPRVASCPLPGFTTGKGSPGHHKHKHHKHHKH